MIRRKLCTFFIIMTIAINAVQASDNPQNSQTIYDFENLNRIPIKIKILEEISTKDNIFEGEKVVFTTTESTVITHKKVLPSGSRVFGTVETISPSEKSGIPGNLIVSNFKIEYMPAIKLEGKILKIGSDRTCWVRAFLPFFFYIHGGQAKISPNEVFEIYYTSKDI